jgi:hypothetical protein
MNRRAWCLVSLICLEGCGQPSGPANPVVAERPQRSIPDDSFLLSVEYRPGSPVNKRSGPSKPSEPSKPTEPSMPSGMPPTETRKTVSLERSNAAKGEVFKPLLFRVGTGEKLDHMTSDGAIDPGRKVLISFVVKAVPKKGTEDKFFRFRIEIGTEAKSDVSLLESDHDYPLLTGQNLGDLIEVDVQSGLYKIGNSVRLGSVRLDSKQPISLQVRWPEGQKE